MKTTNILRLGAVLLIFIMSSCNKDKSSNNVDLSMREQLSEKFNSYEIIELDASQIAQLENSQKNAMVKLEFVDGKYIFDLKNTSPKTQVEVVDMSGEAGAQPSLSYSTFDNYDQAEASNYANFSYVNGLLYGSFVKDGESYTLSPVTNFVKNADDNQYVIYPDENYNAPEISENDPTNKIDQNEYAEELKELAKVGNTSDKKKRGPYLITINAFTSESFRTYCASKNQDPTAYITSNILAVNQKLIQGGMPVRVVLNKITILSCATIPSIDNIITLRKTYFNNFIANNPTQREDANILFVANTTTTASPSTWTIGRPDRLPTLVIEYIDGVAQRDNWLSHEIGHMLGCQHIPRNNSTIPGVMNPYIYPKAAEYKAQTKTNMTNFVNAYHVGL